MYDTRLHIFPGKLKSRWIGPFIIHRVYSNGVVELLNSNGKDSFKSMDIVSSHSWSHSNQKRRQSTSLSLKKPKQKGCVLIVLNDPRWKKFQGIERKKSGRNRSKTEKNREKQSSAKFRRLKKLLRNEHFVAKPFRNTVEVSASFAAAKGEFGTRVPLRTQEHHLAAAKRIAKWKSVISHQKSHSAAQCLAQAPFSHCFFFLSHAVQASGHLLRSATSAKVRYPKWREHEGLSLHLLRTARRVCERSQFQILLQSLRVSNSSSGEARAAKAAGDDTLPGQEVGLQKRPRVESSEPIDLTEQSRASHLPSPYSSSSSPVPRDSPVPSPVPSPAPQEKSQEPQAPLPEPQIPAETALEERIQSEAGACPIIPAAEEVPYGALARLQETFSTPDSHGFLSIHDNQPAWANPTELEMVRTLSRGAANRSHLLRGELPPVMFLIDAFLRHNLYPLQHWTKEGESSRSSLQDVRRIFLWASSSDLAALLYFEEKVHKRSFRELIAFPSSFQGCYAKFWSTWDILLSLSWRESEFAESIPRHIPEGITVAAPAIPRAPPAAPASSQPSTSADRGWPFLYLNIESCAVHWRLLQLLRAVLLRDGSHRACQEQIATLSSSESHPPEPQAPADAPTEEADPSA
ncbi:hypothetical protein CK203_046482 [Vitis vinifera]|uniref:Uncharacterized protein n=1 Tax=Vitis vinifera TaxID=29760 RepID=A0A438ILJ2_VITVI|nr:hypothetical protein CK203_046482 [Vitis vinifera]